MCLFTFIKALKNVLNFNKVIFFSPHVNYYVIISCIRLRTIMLFSLLKICMNEMRVIFSTCLLCMMLFMMIHTPLIILYILCRIVYMLGL